MVVPRLRMGEVRGRISRGGSRKEGDRVPVSHRPLGRSLLGLVTPKFLSRSAHPLRLPAPARDRSPGRAAPGPPGAPSPIRDVTCPALPAPGRRVPGRGVVEQPGSSSSCSPGARQGERTAELSPGAKAEASHPGRGAEPRAGGRREARGGPGGARSGPLSPPARTSRPRPRGQARQRPRQPGRAP